eukprot:844928_1
MKSNDKNENKLLGNIVLSGASSMFTGMAKRLENELQNLVKRNAKNITIDIKVHSPPQRNYSAFIGGSIISSLEVFEDGWIVKEQYDEYGPSIVHRKFIRSTMQGMFIILS